MWWQLLIQPMRKQVAQMNPRSKKLTLVHVILYFELVINCTEKSSK